MDKLYAADVEDISIVENYDDELKEDSYMIDEAEDTMTILSKYVNSLNVKNKNQLDKLLKSLYNESLTVETLRQNFLINNLYGQLTSILSKMNHIKLIKMNYLLMFMI